MKQLDEFTYQYDNHAEAWKDEMKEYLSLWRQWLRWRFFYLVMEYLDNKTPEYLMRDEFNAQLEYIYEHDKVLYQVAWITLDDLKKWHELQNILEDWNDLYPNNEPDGDE